MPGLPIADIVAGIKTLHLRRDLHIQVADIKIRDPVSGRAAFYQTLPGRRHIQSQRGHRSQASDHYTVLLWHIRLLINVLPWHPA